MTRRSRGIRYVRPGRYEINYQVDGVRDQHRINASTLGEAKIIRDEYIMELRKKLSLPQTERERVNASFEEAWEKLVANLQSDSLPRKTVLRYKRTYWRMVDEFKDKHYSHVK